MQPSCHKQESYQRAILDIEVHVNSLAEDRCKRLPSLPTKRKKLPKSTDSERDHLIIQPSRLSRELEFDITERETELCRFRETSQNAVVSPLLSQALVKKTVKYLESLPTRDRFGPKGVNRFRKIAKIVGILCGLCRFWKRYDVGLLLKIGKSQDDRQISIPRLTSRLKKSTLRLSTFDTRHFATFQSKISNDLKECLNKPPFRRTKSDKTKISALLHQYKVFQMFSEEKQKGVSTLVGYERYEPGRVICLQSRNCDRFYFILSGLVSKVKTLYFANGVKKRYLKELHQGSHTDLYETLRYEERSYSLICKTEVEVLLLERHDLQSLFYNEETEVSIKRLINSLSLFKTYPSAKLFSLDTIKVHFYAKHVVIESSISESPNVFIVKTGSCSVYMKKSTVKVNKKNHFFKANEIQDWRELSGEFNKALDRLPRICHQEEAYVLVGTIHRGEIYGLHSLLPRVQNMVRTLVSGTSTESSSVAFQKSDNTILVSKGAECLLVNKNKFLNHSDFCTISKLTSLEKIDFPPSLKTLHQSLQWTKFKKNLVKELKEES